MSTSRRPIRHELLTWADIDKLVDVLLPQLRSAGYFDALKAANVSPASWPQLLWLVDPNDYLKPMVFEIKDE